MKKLLCLLLVLVSSTAYAGKDEREKQEEVTKEMPASQAAFKSACGCDLAFDVKWDTFQTFETMRAVHGIIDNVQSYAKDVCTDATAKKNVCKMKSMSISYAPIAANATANPDPVFNEATGVMTLVTNGMAVPDLQWMARNILDK